MTQKKYDDGSHVNVAGEVPCGGCTLCCKSEVIYLYPQHGDQYADYEILPAGGGRWALRRDESGCHYLGEHGCTIWPQRPFLCRVFDCRDLLKYSKKQLREMLDKGEINADVLKRARELKGERE